MSSTRRLTRSSGCEGRGRALAARWTGLIPGRGHTGLNSCVLNLLLDNTLHPIPCFPIPIIYPPSSIASVTIVEAGAVIVRAQTGLYHSGMLSDPRLVRSQLMNYTHIECHLHSYWVSFIGQHIPSPSLSSTRPHISLERKVVKAGAVIAHAQTGLYPSGMLATPPIRSFPVYRSHSYRVTFIRPQITSRPQPHPLPAHICRLSAKLSRPTLLSCPHRLAGTRSGGLD